MEDRDIYPADVVEQDLQLVYYGEQLLDVLSVALEEKPDASLQDLVDALNYYNQHDSFYAFWLLVVLLDLWSSVTNKRFHKELRNDGLQKHKWNNCPF